MKFKEAFRIAETNYRRSQQLQHQNQLMESQHMRDTNVMRRQRRLWTYRRPQVDHRVPSSSSLRVPASPLASLRLRRRRRGKLALLSRTKTGPREKPGAVSMMPGVTSSQLWKVSSLSGCMKSSLNLRDPRVCLSLLRPVAPASPAC